MKCLAGAFLVLVSSPGVPQEGRAKALIEIWDTQQTSDSPWAISSRKGWTPVAAGQAPASFTGDAVMTNGPVTIIVRKRDLAVEVYGD